MANGKALIWLGDTKAELSAASVTIRIAMGGALRAAQEGSKAHSASSMKGSLREVVEVREDDESGTYRLMYTVTIGDNVYVLDFFQKKSKSGIATPKANLDRIAARLAQAKRSHASTIR